MRKFGITTLAVLYAVLILSMSVERTSAWANQESYSLAHHSLAHDPEDRHTPGLNSAPQAEAYISQKKIVETEFAMELPRETVLFQNHSERQIPLSSFEYHTGRNGQPSSSRSPPAA